MVAAKGFDVAPPLNVPAVSSATAIALLVAGSALLLAGGTRALKRADL